MDDPEIMYSADAAKYLGVSRRTIYRWVRAGQLEADRQGRVLQFSKSHLEALHKPKTSSEQPASAESHRTPESMTPDAQPTVPTPPQSPHSPFYGGQRDLTIFWRLF
jgi:excisionase family DNA binding protein